MPCLASMPRISSMVGARSTPATRCSESFLPGSITPGQRTIHGVSVECRQTLVFANGMEMPWSDLSITRCCRQTRPLSTRRVPGRRHRPLAAPRSSTSRSLPGSPASLAGNRHDDLVRPIDSGRRGELAEVPVVLPVRRRVDFDQRSLCRRRSRIERRCGSSVLTMRKNGRSERLASRRNSATISRTDRPLLPYIISSRWRRYSKAFCRDGTTCGVLLRIPV